MGEVLLQFIKTYMLFRMPSALYWYLWLLSDRDCRKSIFGHLKQATGMRTISLSRSLLARHRWIHRLVLKYVATSFARPSSDSVSLLSMQSSWLGSNLLEEASKKRCVHFKVVCRHVRIIWWSLPKQYAEHLIENMPKRC